MENINERQLALYNYLLNKSRNEQWVTRKQILNDLRDIYNYNDEVPYYSTGATNLTRDIRTLNYSPSINKIIIFNSAKGIKIANKEETKMFLNRNLQSVLKRLKLQTILQDKAKKDGQLIFEKSEIKETQSFLRR